MLVTNPSFFASIGFGAPNHVRYLRSQHIPGCTHNPPYARMVRPLMKPAIANARGLRFIDSWNQ